MNKIPWYRRVQFQLPVIIFLVILIPTAVFVLYTAQNTRLRQEHDTAAAMGQRLSETAFLLSDSMREIEAAGKTFLSAPTFPGQFDNWVQNPQDPAAASRLLLALGQSAWPHSTIEGMYLIADDAPSILSSHPRQKILPVSPKEEAAGNALYHIFSNQMQGETYWTRLSGNLFPNTPDAESDRLAYWRSSSVDNQEHDGALVLVMNPETLRSAVSALVPSEDGLGFIRSYSGQLLYASIPDAIQLENDSSALSPFLSGSGERSGEPETEIISFHGQDWMTVHYHSLDDGLLYTCALPCTSIYTGLSGGSFFFTLLLAGISAVLLGSLALSFLVLKPLGKLQKQLGKLEQGQMDPMNAPFPRNEIGLVLTSYNRMVLQLKKLIDQVYVQQLLRKQAQLSSLQAQMDEHFLYNTLNTIYYKAEEENAGACGAMILKLSRYFRLNLSQGQEKIPLSDIVSLIRTYLQIQQLRYGQNLGCQISEFPDMNQYVSLKQLYQPLIENAVIHGFERKPGNHHLWISFQKKEDCLLFVVQDDGIGMTPEQISAATAPSEDFERVRGKGFALKNIMEQIRIAYGDEYGLSLTSEPGKGTVAALRVPLERRTECEKNMDS